MKEKDVVSLSKHPYTKDMLIYDFKQLGIKKGDCLLVHCSMSKLGWIIGREATLVQALIDTIGENGTIVMPSQTGDNSEPSLWNNPPVPESWYQSIRDHMPPIDRYTPVRAMGKAVEYLLSLSTTLRSYHPQVSFIAYGKYAKEMTDNHALTPGLGINSPLGQLYAKHAKVLLLGVGYNNCTCLHLSETQLKNIKYKKTGSRMYINGENIWKEYQDIDYDDSDFEKLGLDYEKHHHVKKGKVGLYTCRLLDIKDLCDYASEWFENNR